jgi:parvulin-like peptidyl-prolyl isomerase
MQQFVEPFRNAASALAVGATSVPVETQFGVHIIQVTGSRQGDISEADAKHDIARRLFRDAQGMESAQAAARLAIQRIQGGADIAVVANEMRASVKPRGHKRWCLQH